MKATGAEKTDDNDKASSRIRLTSVGDSEVSSQSASPGGTGGSNVDDDDDDEFRRAADMAIAVQNNPNMTLEDIQHLRQTKGNMDSDNLISPSMAAKKGRSFRFDGSRLTAIRAVVTGQQTAIRESSAHGGEQQEDMADYINRERNRRILDGHRLKAAFHRDQSREIPSRGGGTVVNPDLENNNGPNSKTVNSTANTSSSSGVGRLMRTTKTRTPPQSPLKAAASDVSGKYVPPTSTSVDPSSKLTSTTLLQNLQSVINHSKQIPNSKAPIRLTGIAWKRRGGMGKYSTSGGWERRRIELQGSCILYYAKDETDDVQDDDEEVEAGHPALPSSNPAEDITGKSSSTAQPFKRDNTTGEDVNEGVVITKQSNWFESTFAQHHEDPNTPRGYLDLAKEKASVHAALGHGAPTPFAISIKVRGETKFKFCFDHHRTQMEWLTALTDVVVQNSVDICNASLLEGADPAHSDGFGLLAGTISAPKSPMAQSLPQDNGGGVRPWQVQSYTISSQASRYEHDDAYDENEPDDEDNDDIASVHEEGGLSSNLLSEDDHQKAQVSAVEECMRKWVIPEGNFTYLAALCNTAIAIARMSVLSLEGFWFLVVFVNALIYFLLVKEPDWKNLVTYIRALPPEVKKKEAVGIGMKAKEKSISKINNKPDGPTQSGDKGNMEFKPVAGTTTVKLKNPTDLPVNDKNEVFAGWRSPPGDSLLVRSHGYLTTKKKVPSPGELYDLLHCDIFEAPTRFPDIATLVKLPEVSFPDDENKGAKTWRAPDVFVITIALPTDPPKLGRSSGDGGGYTIAMYFRMKQETRDILRRVTAEGFDLSKEDYGDDMQKTQVNAVRLLEEWVRRAPTDQSWFSRFKCIPNAHNLREIGMPGWISKYNGKPFLIKRPGVTGFIHQHPELSVFEFDISLHPFPYLARQGICFLKESFFKQVLVTFGFVIEGRAEDELPECVIGCLQLCYPDPAHAIQAKDFFSGTSVRSF